MSRFEDFLYLCLRRVHLYAVSTMLYVCVPRSILNTSKHNCVDYDRPQSRGLKYS